MLFHISFTSSKICIQVTPTSSGGILLHQQKYILNLLHNVNLSGAKPQFTPMATGLKLAQHGTDLFSNPKLYSALHYLCITRPDLTFVVNI